ncbi:hypothetical protein [Algoriphagus resistens]|uniref:hypothetical protein n=1 Tax=Algoriphagus resistens TaxID=1750590 RepID=UPI00071683DF|nr:hypothetical protein [Algoriphagus resistens]
MKSPFNQITTLVLFCSFFSCAEKNQSESTPITFSLKITDSVEIDHLGEMKLLDYEPKTEKFLLATEEPREYLEVDWQGNILNHNEFNRDGIDVVVRAVSLGYFNGDVTVFDVQKGYFRFQDSTKIGEITLPYDYDVFLLNPKLGLFESGDKIYYPKPVPTSLMANHAEENMFQLMYNLPIIESQDKTTGDTLSALRLPETSEVFDNQIHGFLMPVYTMDKDKLLLSIGIEPKFYVYHKEGDQFVYSKTVEVAIPDWVAYTPVPADKPKKFFEEIRKIRPGNLGNVFTVGDYYLISYHSGISEEELAQLDPSTSYGVDILKRDPYYAAIFDKDFNQLATNVPFPSSSNSPMVVNNEGELVVSKVAGLSETEEDGIVLYKLKLTEK